METAGAVWRSGSSVPVADYSGPDTGSRTLWLVVFDGDFYHAGQCVYPERFQYSTDSEQECYGGGFLLCALGVTGDRRSFLWCYFPVCAIDRRVLWNASGGMAPAGVGADAVSRCT